jgi:hypothetical protein
VSQQDGDRRRGEHGFTTLGEHLGGGVQAMPRSGLERETRIPWIVVRIESL